MNVERSKWLWLAKHVVSLLLAIAVAKWGPANTAWNKIFNGVLSGLLAEAFITIVQCNKEMEDTLRSALYLRPIKDTASAGPSPRSIDDLFRRLSHLRRRDIAFEFATDALRQIVYGGFVQLDRTAPQYAEWLARCCRRLRHSLGVTCTVRPAWFVGGASRRSHLKPFRDARCNRYKIRLMSLSVAEIQGIVVDALQAVEPSGGGGSTAYEAPPEISWFIDKASGGTRRIRVFWTEETLLRRKGSRHFTLAEHEGRVQDYAVFDGELVVKYGFSEVGDLYLDWDEERVAEHSQVFEFLNNNAANADMLADAGVFTSFEALLQGVGAEITVDWQAVLGAGAGTVVQTLGSMGVPSPAVAHELYQRVAQAVRGGTLRFKDDPRWSSV